MTNKIYLSNGLNVSVVKGKWVNFDKGVLSIKELTDLVNLSRKDICVINIKFARSGKTFVSKRNKTLTIWVGEDGIKLKNMRT